MQLKLKKLQKMQRAKRLDFDLLQKDSTVKEENAVEVRNRFQGLTSAAENTIPDLQRQAKKSRTAGKILETMNERRKSIRNNIRDKELDHEIKWKCEIALPVKSGSTDCGQHQMIK